MSLLSGLIDTRTIGAKIDFKLPTEMPCIICGYLRTGYRGQTNNPNFVFEIIYLQAGIRI